MTRARKKPRGFYARLARARGVTLQVVYLELNRDKWLCARAQEECDATWPWSREYLARMDRAFCDAVRREIARGTERPRGRAATPAVTRTRPAPLPRRAGGSSRERRE